MVTNSDCTCPGPLLKFLGPFQRYNRNNWYAVLTHPVTSVAFTTRLVRTSGVLDMLFVRYSVQAWVPRPNLVQCGSSVYY